MSDSRSDPITGEVFTDLGTKVSDEDMDQFFAAIAAAFASPKEDVPLTPGPTDSSDLASTEPELSLFIEIGLGVNSRKTFMLVGGTDGLYVHVCKENEDLANTVSLLNSVVPVYDPFYYEHQLNAIFFNPNDLEAVSNYRQNFISKEDSNDPEAKRNALQEHFDDEIYIKKLEEYCKKNKSHLMGCPMSTSMHSFFPAAQATINTKKIPPLLNDDQIQTNQIVHIAPSAFLNVNTKQELGPPILIGIGKNHRSFVLIGRFYVHVCEQNENPNIVARSNNSAYKANSRKPSYKLKNHFFTDDRFERTVFFSIEAYPQLKSKLRMIDISVTTEEEARKRALGNLYENAEYCKQLENFRPQPSESSSKVKMPKPVQKRPTNENESAKIMAKKIIRRFEKEEEASTLKRKR